MPRKPLDELYFTWLYNQVAVGAIRNPHHTYWHLLRKMFTKEFVWFVPNDDNREKDGQALRLEFLEDEHIHVRDRSWMQLSCSMLELLIGLARRLSFFAEGEPENWFWKLVENLDLERYNDNVRFPEDEVDHILEKVIFRTYRPDGSGGLFPLENAAEDQRKVELWYQMHSYILERS